MIVRRSNVDRTASTRRQLTRAARGLFSERGYSSTTLAAIAKSVGLTTGALYHHWAGKEDLLVDVVHDVYSDLAQRIRDFVAPEDDPFDQLLRSGRAFLSMSSDPAVARLLLLDAPAVLGYARWREIDDRWWLAATTRLLEQARGRPARADDAATRPLALALLGALTYLGHEVASQGGDSAVESATRTYEVLLRAALR